MTYHAIQKTRKHQEHNLQKKANQLIRTIITYHVRLSYIISERTQAAMGCFRRAGDGESLAKWQVFVLCMYIYIYIEI